MCTINIHSYFYDQPRGDPSPPVIFIYFSQLFNLFLRSCDPGSRRITLVITEITPTNSKFHTVQYTGIQVLFCLPDPNIFNNTASQSLNHNKLLLKAVIFIERSIVYQICCRRITWVFQTRVATITRVSAGWIICQKGVT